LFDIKTISTPSTGFPAESSTTPFKIPGRPADAAGRAIDNKISIGRSNAWSGVARRSFSFSSPIRASYISQFLLVLSRTDFAGASLCFSVIILMGNSGMEKRPLRLGLHEEFFEGTQFFMIKAKGMDEEVRGRLSGLTNPMPEPF
jgi:hypothetical protein